MMIPVERTVAVAAVVVVIPVVECPLADVPDDPLVALVDVVPLVVLPAAVPLEDPHAAKTSASTPMQDIIVARRPRRFFLPLRYFI